MAALRRPDWTEPVATGLWGLGYNLRADQGLVLLSNKETLPSDDPERLWPFILTESRQRNRLLEQSIAKQDDLRPFLEHLTVGRDDVLGVREKDINELISILAKEPVQQGSTECGKFRERR